MSLRSKIETPHSENHFQNTCTLPVCIVLWKSAGRNQTMRQMTKLNLEESDLPWLLHGCNTLLHISENDLASERVGIAGAVFQIPPLVATLHDMLHKNQQ